MTPWTPIPRITTDLPDLQPGEFELRMKVGHEIRPQHIALREVLAADVSRQVTHWRQLNVASPALSAVRAIDHRCGLWKEPQQ